MAVLTVVEPAETGTVIAAVACAGGGDTFVTSAGETYDIQLRNGHSSSQSVIIDDPNTAGPTGATAFNPDNTVAVVNATEKVIRIKADRYRVASTGVVSLTYTGVTALTITVTRVGRTA